LAPNREGNILLTIRELPIVFQRHQQSKSIAHSGARGTPSRNGSQALRLSLVSLVLVSSVPVGLGILPGLPPERFADSLRAVSDTWTRMQASVPWRSGVQQRVATEATQGPVAGASWVPLAVAKSSERGVIAYGDRLKITFFESLGVTLDDRGASSDHVVAAVFPRMDLSADYAVDDGGSVNIPKLGQFATAGQTITALQSELAAAFLRAIGRTSDVHVAIVERQPVYVLGTVRNAGTFKHAPGMTVLQVLAAAGGIDLGIADTSRAIESIRETERLRQAEDRQDRLLVRQARLIAQRENADGITTPPSIRSRLSQATPHEGLNALLAGAAATLGVERKSYQRQLSLALRQVSISRIEIAAQTLRANQLKELLVKKEERLRGLEGIAARGSVSQYKLMEVNVDMSELVARQEDLRVALAQSERRLVEAENAQAKIELDYSVGIERDLAATNEDIEDCAKAIASMQATTQVLRNSLPQVAAGSAGSRPRLRITRRVAAGLTAIDATEMTALLPGDVVQVNSDNGAEAPPPGLAQVVQRLQN
jgi:polysaccharide biosynthesis/export protein ExoF